MKPYINKLLTVPLFLVLLSACRISKDIATPVPELPAAFRNAAADTSAPSVAELQIPSFFTDTTLLGLVNRALEHNYDMQLALKNIEAASALYRQVKWNYVPDLRLQVSAGSNRPSDNSLSGLSASSFLGTTHIEDFNASLGLSWEADIWGKIRNQKKSARAAYIQTQEVRNLVQTEIVSRVAQGYYNLMMLDAQLNVARRYRSLNDSTLRIIQLQYSSGQVTTLAVEQAEAQLLASEQLIPQLEQQVVLQENALSLLAGALPAATDRSVMPQDGPPSGLLATGVPSGMVARRPDVRMAELSLDIANARVGIAKANMYPSLSITAGGGVNAFKASNWFNIPASLFGTVAGSVVQPLLNRRLLHTQYKVAKIEREKSVLQFRQSVLYAVGEVSDALVKLEKLDQQYQVATRRVGTLRQATSHANLLFEGGLANYLEVITAQRSVLQSELEVAGLRRDQYLASVDLYRALGGGWK
jgi:NodT family efflux transporter outer membrane factor (OMF) lipoprotein